VKFNPRNVSVLLGVVFVGCWMALAARSKYCDWRWKWDHAIILEIKEGDVIKTTKDKVFRKRKFDNGRESATSNGSKDFVFVVALEKAEIKRSDESKLVEVASFFRREEISGGKTIKELMDGWNEVGWKRMSSSYSTHTGTEVTEDYPLLRGCERAAIKPTDKVICNILEERQ
jgi:hypothetical protein